MSWVGLVVVWGYCLFAGVSLGLAYVLPDAIGAFFLLVAIGNAALAGHFWRLDTE